MVTYDTSYAVGDVNDATSSSDLTGVLLVPIPWIYVIDGGAEHQFATVTSTTVSDASGTTRHTKGGATIQFGLNDPSQNLP